MDARFLTAPMAAAILAGGEAPESLPLRVDMGRMLLKATPAVEGGQRVIYMEASSEVRDQQGERVLTEALRASVPYFLRYGKIDLDHATMTGEILGKRVDPYAYEIGRPLDAKVDGASVFVKAAIYQSRPGERNAWTEAADLFWDSLKATPPVVWYPSVAGQVYSEAPVTDPVTGVRTQEIRGIRWNAIGLSRTPVNQAVAPISLTPLRVFAKAFGSQAGMTDLLRDLARPAHRIGESGEGAPFPHTITEHQFQQFLELLQRIPDGEGFPAVVAAARPAGITPQQAMAMLLAIVDT